MLRQGGFSGVHWGCVYWGLVPHSCSGQCREKTPLPAQPPANDLPTGVWARPGQQLRLEHQDKAAVHQRAVRAGPPWRRWGRGPFWAWTTNCNLAACPRGIARQVRGGRQVPTKTGRQALGRAKISPIGGGARLGQQESDPPTDTEIRKSGSLGDCDELY